MSVPAAPLRVCLDARLVSGERGGVEQVIIGLAGAFSRLEDGDEEYSFLVDPGHTAWIEPFVFGRSKLLMSARPPASQTAAGTGPWTARRLLKAAVPGPVRAALRSRRSGEPAVPPSDGTIERVGIDVMHFPMQVGFETAVPTIFTPHDLQHLHLPEFFSAREIAAREERYRALCEKASLVMLMSSWARDDVVASYGIPKAKTIVVPGAADNVAARAPGPADAALVRERFGVKGPFALYPAKAWPHKNHLRLVTALKLLRSRGVDVPVILTGGQSGLDAPVTAAAQAAGVGDLLHFVGFVTPDEMGALYRSARLLVFPSLFEGWGLPVLEAMAAGLPVACSNATCLPAMAAGAAEIVDPLAPESIAAAIERIWQDEELRSHLRAAGLARAGEFSWHRSALILRAAYRKLGGRELSGADVALLATPPIV